MRISVVISTYNRSASLRKTIESLLNQEHLQDIIPEIIIVDHACTDNTKSMVQRFMAVAKVEIRYVYEAHPGISVARNRGITESRGEIIAFTDDDVIADRYWLASIGKAFKETGCDVLAGKILPIYPEKTPHWIKDNQDFLNGPIVYRNHGAQSRFYDAAMLPFIGAHMVFARQCFADHGMFTTDVGFGTDFPYGGEDTEMFFRLLGRKKIYYCADCVVWHAHQKERVTLRYVTKWFYVNGMSYAKQEQGLIEGNARNFLGIPPYLYKRLMVKFFAFLGCLFDKRKRLESWCKLVWSFGLCFGVRTHIFKKDEPMLFKKVSV